MKLLPLMLGTLMTTFVALPVLAAVGNSPYTADAKAPPTETGPRYTVTLATGRALTWLNRSEEAPLPSIRLPNRRFPFLPNYQEVVPNAVNRHHQMVGFYRGGGSGAYLVILARPFSYQRGRLRFLPTLPDYTITHPLDLNDKGEIVGNAALGSFPGDENVPAHAVCWVHRKVHDLGTGEAASANNAGDIVGDSGAGPAISCHPVYALIWTHSYRYDLNTCIPPGSGWVLTTADSINNKGQIVGYGLFHGKERAFLLTPRSTT